MDEIVKILIEQGLPALLGGGAVALFTIPEKRGSARLDNAERILKKYEDIINKLEEDNKDKDMKIVEMRTKIEYLETSLATVNTTLKTLQIIEKEDRVLRCEILRCKNRKPKMDIKELESIVEEGQK